MGVARIGPYRFNVDPQAVSLPYDIKTKDQKAVGGKVVQVLGARLGDLMISGQFISWEEQYDFFKRVKKMGNDQTFKPDGTVADPWRFLYPTKGWSFGVYLKSFTSVDGPRPVTWSNSILAPRWSLTLFISDDQSGLKKVAQDVFISRLAEGVGWKRSEFSAPMTEFDFRLAQEEGTYDPSTASPPQQQNITLEPTRGVIVRDGEPNLYRETGGG